MHSVLGTNNEFDEIVAIIEEARQKAFRAVNRELIEMYWQIGQYISEKVKSNAWGKSIVTEFASFVQSKYVGIKGFSAQNIWRMKQFYETYAGNEKLSPLVRELPWTNNILIMVSAKTDEAREFYINLSIKNGYSKRELERQLDSMLFERTMISNQVNQLQLSKHEELASFRDSYVLDRDVRKPNENPSIGLILCASKDETVVEYALNRSMSPALVAEYKLHLPDKAILENKLRELQLLLNEKPDNEN